MIVNLEYSQEKEVKAFLNKNSKFSIRRPTLKNALQEEEKELCWKE